jgi:hypothetical protein
MNMTKVKLKVTECQQTLKKNLQTNFIRSKKAIHLIYKSTSSMKSKSLRCFSVRELNFNIYKYNKKENATMGNWIKKVFFVCYL